MLRVLFNISNITQLNEHLKVAKSLIEKKNYELIFLLNEYKGNFEVSDVVKKINEIEAKVFLDKDIQSNISTHSYFSIFKFIPSRICNYVYRKLRVNLIVTAQIIDVSRGKLKSYRMFLKNISPNLVIVAEDGIGSNIHLISAANKCGTKVLVIPYEYSGKKQLLLGARQNYSYKTNLFSDKYNRFLSKYFFKENEDLFGFLSIDEIFGYKFTGVLPINIKTVHGGNANYIAVESPSMEKHYLNEGISPAKLKLTGTLNDDIILKNLENKTKIKAELTAQYGLNPNLSLILFSFIPDYKEVFMFIDYNDYVSSIHTLLSKNKTVNAIYQFHPAVKEVHRKTAIDLGLQVSNHPTIELIAACDVYITSYSSTIRWASAMGKPVIDIDIYGFDFDDYKNNSGVTIIKKRNDLEDAFQQIHPDSNLISTLNKNLVNEKHNWGMLDGKSSERIHNLIRELCQKH